MKNALKMIFARSDAALSFVAGLCLASQVGTFSALADPLTSSSGRQIAQVTEPGPRGDKVDPDDDKRKQKQGPAKSEQERPQKGSPGQSSPDRQGEQQQKQEREPTQKRGERGRERQDQEGGKAEQEQKQREDRARGDRERQNQDRAKADDQKQREPQREGTGPSGEELPKLERLAKVIKSILERRPREVFLIEGHTDAVGSEVDNLTLSDRRAESVAVILSDSFEVSPENLTTQGYGEQFLKVDTQEAERSNRRVAIRRITPLLSKVGETDRRPASR